MFWEGRTQSAALNNLGVVLNNLRKTVGPYVTIDRQLSMNPDSDWWLDVFAFEESLDAKQ